jgi:hypothetical protein
VANYSFRDPIIGTEHGEDTRLKAALKNVALWCLVISLALTVLTPTQIDGQQIENFEVHGLYLGRILQEAKTALLIGALLAFTLEISSRRETFRSFRNHLSQSEAVIARGISAISGGVALINFPQSLEHSGLPDIIKEVGRTIFVQYVQGLEFEDGTINVRSINWALESNRVFYDFLLKSGVSDLDIRVTHVGSPSEWLGAEAKQALEKQRDLVRKKTKSSSITRIFVGVLTKEDAKKNPAYSQVMDLMSKDGIRTGYVQSKEPRSLPDMTWIPQLNILMFWKVEGLGSESIQILNDREQSGKLEDRWRELVRDAEWWTRP